MEIDSIPVFSYGDYVMFMSAAQIGVASTFTVLRGFTPFKLDIKPRAVSPALLEENAYVDYPFGVLVLPYSLAIRNAFGDQGALAYSGAVVVEVLPSSFAEKIGLKIGDVIISIMGTVTQDGGSPFGATLPISSSRDFQHSIEQTRRRISAVRIIRASSVLTLSNSAMDVLPQAADLGGFLRSRSQS